MRIELGLILLLCSWGAMSLMGQEYLSMIDEPGYSLEEIQAAAEEHFEIVGTGRGTGYKQYKRWEYNARRMQTAEGELLPEDYFIKEWHRWQAERFERADLRTGTNDYWTEHGPQSWNATSGWNPGIGRVTSMQVNPNDPNHIIIGAQTGGVWHTFNRGEVWKPLTDNFSNMEVYSVAFHPLNPEIYYFGSGGGRLYRSEDAGATWSKIGDVGSSLVNKILIHPTQPDTIFAASQRSGLFRSVDGGNQWQSVVSDGSGFDFAFHPTDLNTVYASGSGVHVSHDGGFTFTSVGTEEPREENMNILSPDSLSGSYVVAPNAFVEGYVPLPVEPEEFTAEVVMYRDEGDSTLLACSAPTNADSLRQKIALIRRGECTFVEKVLAAQNAGAFAVIIVNNEPGVINMSGEGEGIFIPAVMVEQELGEDMIEALQAGESLRVQFQQPLQNNFKNGPKMIGVSPDAPDRIYVLEAEGGVFGGMYRSDNQGESFGLLPHFGKNYFGYSTAADDDRGQAPRDMGIAVNPFDADEVHIAGINTWVSRNGGENFQPTSDWIPGSAAGQNIGYCHADVDDLLFVDSMLYAVTDGGVFVAENSSFVNPEFYKDLSPGLGIRQFYKIGISQTDPVWVSGGSQDNGTSLLTDEGEWIDWLGADGMETFIDKEDPTILCGTSQFGAPYVSFNGAQSYIGMVKPGSETGRWVTPFEQDPIVSDVIYLGYEQVFRSEDYGQTWTSISQEFPQKLDHLKIAPSDNSVMWAAHGSELYKTEIGGGNWENVTGFAGNVNSIAIHPRDPNKVAIATNSVSKVYVTENGGQSWMSFRKNLPNFAALALVWQNDDFDGLYLGMNYGVFFIDNTRDEWVAFDNHLPNVIINELEINEEQQRIYAATYGRGLWSSPIFGATSSTETLPTEDMVEVFPNPARSVLNIRMDAQRFQRADIRLFNSAGQPVRYHKDAFLQTHSIDLTGLNPGTYYLHIASELGGIVKKVIVQ